MSITKDAAKAQTETAHNAAETTANNLFIAAADLQISEAIALGVFWTTCRNFDLNANPSTIAQYYVNLGYRVYFLDIDGRGQPDIRNGHFWNDAPVPIDLNKPFRIKIAWS